MFRDLHQMWTYEFRDVKKEKKRISEESKESFA